MPPVYFFAIDVSAEAVSSGLLAVVCDTIKAALDSLPGDERTLVGLVTYDAHVHFYNLSAFLLSDLRILAVAPRGFHVLGLASRRAGIEG